MWETGATAHITWEMAERALEQGFLPDTISSDLTAPGRTDRVFDFPTVLSKFLMLGLSLEQVIARATINAAKRCAVQGAGHAPRRRARRRGRVHLSSVARSSSWTT